MQPDNSGQGYQPQPMQPQQTAPPQPQQPAPNQFQQQPIQANSQLPPPPPSGKSNTGLIIGIVIGVIVLIFIIIIAAYFLFFNNKTVSNTQPKEVVSQSTPAASSCLVASDFDNIYKENTGATRPASPDYTKEPYQYTSNVHFKPDSLEFTEPVGLANQVITSYINFGNQYKDKQFVIRLHGSVGTTDRADGEFANQRAQKVKDMLVAGGVSPSKIVIDPPKNVQDSTINDPNAVSKQSARNVIMAIDTTCSSSTNGEGR